MQSDGSQVNTAGTCRRQTGEYQYGNEGDRERERANREREREI
jgi:hypothetical protein